MKSTIYILLTGLFALGLSSCSKWLDVKPEDRFTEEQIFSNVNGFSDAINGVYLNLTDNNLYGSQLTLSVLELLAQRYNISSVHDMDVVMRYSYEEPAMQSRLNGIWTGMYYNIANVNRFIENLDKYSHNIDKETADLFRGEAYGLRGFLHFELLRMFGPIYVSTDSIQPSIPYYHTVSRNFGEIEPANKIMDLVLADLDTAAQLLRIADPIVEKGIVGNDIQSFQNYRNYRMNYFAVKGIQARALLWRGDKVGALNAVKSVIDEQAKFPWISHDKIMVDKANPDRVFSTENLFMLEVPQLYNNYNAMFSFNVKDDKILAPTDTYLANLFEGELADYRYTPMWINTGTGKAYRTFFKYADVEYSTTLHRFAVPLLRISEMYYIAAECETDPQLALSYLNIVREHRSLQNLSATADLQKEIGKEYAKEFYGEGQLWYYFKRTKTTQVPSSNGVKNISLYSYVFPLPLTETDPR